MLFEANATNATWGKSLQPIKILINPFTTYVPRVETSQLPLGAESRFTAPTEQQNSLLKYFEKGIDSLAVRLIKTQASVISLQLTIPLICRA